MAGSTGDMANGFGMLGSAVSSIFGGIGDMEEGSAYNKAAEYAAEDAKIAQESENLQLYQANRNINMTIGAQRAEVGGAGLAQSGTALDLMRSSQQQGALTKQLVKEQGQINVIGYEQESAAYKGMAAAADASGTGSILGGIAQGVGAALLISDYRLNEDITYVGPSSVPGVARYTFRYLGQKNVFEGVMAQEVEKVRPDAVDRDHMGYLRVNYEALGEQMRLVE